MHFNHLVSSIMLIATSWSLIAAATGVPHEHLLVCVSSLFGIKVPLSRIALLQCCQLFRLLYCSWS